MFGRTFELHPGTELVGHRIFYIGSESATLTNIMMCLGQNQVYSFDPSTSSGRRETLNVSRALMRRYFLVQKAKDASVIGIVVGTLGVAQYQTAIDKLQQLISKAGKKSYTFCVGKLNVAKLANFSEIDVFVIVACPESSLV